MKILWMSNREIINNDISESGSWLVSMASLFQNKKEVELFNITENSSVSAIIFKEKYNIREWVMPRYKRETHGLPSNKDIESILNIINSINPDIIHIWGVESYWGLLAKYGYIKGNILIDIQGSLYACHRVYMGGITLSSIFKVQHILKALYTYMFISLQKFRMYKRLANEKLILRTINNIGVQSKWSKNKVQKLNENANFYNSPMALRDEFLNSSKWKLLEESMTIVTVVSPQAYKGVHVTLEALSLLKERMPNIKLKIIGDINKKSKKGYPLFLFDLIKKMKLDDNVILLGSLNSREMIKEFFSSRALVISSFVESYSLVLAEAMMLGVPCVVSYAGAMPELAEDERSALYFPTGDAEECAYKIERLLRSKNLSENLSKNSILKSEERHKQESVYKKQIQIYKEIIC